MSNPHAKVTAHRQIYAGRVVDLHVESVALPNGGAVDLEIIRHPGAAAVVPLEGDHVVLVRQYRHAAGGYLLEIPAGKLDPGESPTACAQREMAEEIGARAATLTPMGWIWTTPGFTDEKIWLFAAQVGEAIEQKLDDDEVLTVERVPRQQAIQWALDGTLRDCKSICALLRLAHFVGS